MKKLIIMVMAIMMVTNAFGIVTRTSNEQNIIYSTSVAGAVKGTWAVYQPVPSDCIINSAICIGTNRDCYFHASSRTIRAIAYTSQEGGNLPSEINVTLIGAGNCTLGAAQYVEIYNDGTAHQATSAEYLTGDSVVSMPTTCKNLADAIPYGNCNGFVENKELLDYTDVWLSNEITDGQIIGIGRDWLLQPTIK